MNELPQIVDEAVKLKGTSNNVAKISCRLITLYAFSFTGIAKILKLFDTWEYRVG